jgi:hypothetical protein
MVEDAIIDASVVGFVVFAIIKMTKRLEVTWS